MTRTEWLIAGAIVAVAAFVMLYRLGAAPLQDYDEATYAQVAHEMRESGNLFLLTHTGEPYFEKPPLYFWMMDASETLFGENELAMRLPSALGGVLLVAAVMLLAYELSENAVSTLLSGAIVLATAPMVETARQVRLDVPVTFFIVLAAWALARGLKNPRWLLLFGVAAGCAVMIKSYVAVFALLAALCIAAASGRWSWLKSRWFWAGAGLGGLIVVPWHAYQTLVYGMAFWQEYFGYTVIARTAEDLFMVQNTNAQYVWYLANFAFPWTQLFVVMGAVSTFMWRRLDSLRGALAAFAMVAIVLAVFFAAGTKAPTYLVPVYPFAAVFIALVFGDLFARASARGAYIMAIGMALMLALGGVSVWYNGFHVNPYYVQTDELAREEKAVGEMMAGNSAALYAFETTTLGSVMFYSGDVHPAAFEGSAPEGSFILLPTATVSALAELYPRVMTDTLYAGAQLTLVRVSAS